MSYTVQNPQMFTAAYSGAISGMGVSGRMLEDTDPDEYTDLTAVADAFAQKFDTLWGATAVGALEVEITHEACEALWQDRRPTDETAVDPESYTQQCSVIIAIITKSLALFTAEGYTNPSLGGNPVIRGTDFVKDTYTLIAAGSPTSAAGTTTIQRNENGDPLEVDFTTWDDEVLEIDWTVSGKIFLTGTNSFLAFVALLVINGGEALWVVNSTDHCIQVSQFIPAAPLLTFRSEMKCAIALDSIPEPPEGVPKVAVRLAAAFYSDGVGDQIQIIGQNAVDVTINALGSGWLRAKKVPRADYEQIPTTTLSALPLPPGV